MLALGARLASIALINLVLSGDNAVVIAMASHGLPARQRRRAIVLGSGIAVALRVAFTALAALLLQVPALEAAGALLLLWIAYQLLAQEERAEQEGRSHQTTMVEAIRIIVVADLIMSLDNILAVGGASHGDFAMLLFGLLLSIPLVLVASDLVAGLMDRLPWLVWLGAGVLAWTAGGMLLDDRLAGPYTAQVPFAELLVPGASVVLVLGLALRQLLARPGSTDNSRHEGVG